MSMFVKNSAMKGSSISPSAAISAILVLLSSEVNNALSFSAGEASALTLASMNATNSRAALSMDLICSLRSLSTDTSTSFSTTSKNASVICGRHRVISNSSSLISVDTRYSSSILGSSVGMVRELRNSSSSARRRFLSSDSASSRSCSNRSSRCFMLRLIRSSSAGSFITLSGSQESSMESASESRSSSKVPVSWDKFPLMMVPSCMRVSGVISTPGTPSTWNKEGSTSGGTSGILMPPPLFDLSFPSMSACTLSRNL
mmetsp:Transcript_4717/g.8923  ORF Transcript_4717/g.8923 Transcript_4717/m.8923 type:complete len:258 (-) Transcript_4717:65-838(-)